MKILVFSNFFPPEIGAAPMRIWEHAKYWVAQGHEVSVITNVPNSPFGKVFQGYSNRLFQLERVGGIRVARVLTLPAGKEMGKKRRVASFLVSTLMYTLVGLLESRPDVVLATAPYLTGMPGFLTALRHHCTFLYEMRDPWITVNLNHNRLSSGGLGHKILRRMEYFLAQHAKKVIVIGQEMAQFVKNDYKLSKKPSIISNGIDFGGEETDKETDKLPKADGKFVVGVIGNMGSQYDFDVILNAASNLIEKNCLFLFLGGGTQKVYVQQTARNLRLNNVEFVKPVAPDEAKRYMKACDVTIVSMQPEAIYHQYLPKKVLDSLSLGVPVLFAGDGEVKRILNSSGGGVAFASGDTERLTAAIMERKNDKAKLEEEGQRGFAFVKKYFDRRLMAEKYLELMNA